MHASWMYPLLPQAHKLSVWVWVYENETGFNTFYFCRPLLHRRLWLVKGIGCCWLWHKLAVHLVSTTNGRAPDYMQPPILMKLLWLNNWWCHAGCRLVARTYIGALKTCSGAIKSIYIGSVQDWLSWLPHEDAEYLHSGSSTVQLRICKGERYWQRWWNYISTG